MHPSYKLTLADGFSLQITAEDAEAGAVVELLAKAMRLEPGAAENVLRVVTGETETFYTAEAGGAVCRLQRPNSREDAAVRALQISLVIAHMAQKRGGILLHGGLAEFQGQGVILAATSGTGKTTASKRLPAPWRSLSDDAVLIVRKADHYYYGHPWPTWSLFFPGGPGGSWNAERGIPLKTLYFLFQSPEDALAPLNSTQASAMLMESAEQANAAFNRDKSAADLHQNHLEQFSIVCAVTSSLPAFRLSLSLNGRFWTLLEESLRRQAETLPLFSAGRGSGAAFDPVKPIATGVVIAGNSMAPTLAPPGYVEVRPYQNEKPRRGDVVHFFSTAHGTMVTHRVMEVRPEGLVTRGDNNLNNDPDFVPHSAVDGQVVAVRDVRGSRAVAGGAAGMRDFAFARLFNRVRIIAGRIDRRFSLERFLAAGLLRFFSKRKDLKIVLFGHPSQSHLKVMADGIGVGYYERGGWRIVFPWRLRVDRAELEAAVRRMELRREQWMIQSLAERNGK
jgi:SynChlorMet cassette protein ScmC